MYKIMTLLTVGLIAIGATAITTSNAYAHGNNYHDHGYKVVTVQPKSYKRVYYTPYGKKVVYYSPSKRYVKKLQNYKRHYNRNNGYTFNIRFD